MKRIHRIFLILICPILFALPAAAETLTLTNGTRITGTVISRTNGTIVLDAPPVGRIGIPENALQKKPVRKRGQVIVKRLIFAGFSLTHADTPLVSTRMDLLLNRNRLWIDEWTFSVSGRFLREDRTITDRYCEGILRYGRSFSKYFYGFVRTAALHDLASGVDFRFLPTAGAGYWFIESAAVKSFIEAGAGWQHTEYPAAPSASGGVFQLRLIFNWKPASWLRVNTDQFLFPRIDDPSSMRYEVRTTVYIGNPKKGALTVKYNLYLDQNAPVGSKTVSGDLHFGLSLRI